MKRLPARAKKQTGVALILLLVALVLGGAYAFYRSANIGFGSTQQDAKLTLALARAKEALIAYAVIDDKRPGRMLCPDIIGDGVSPTLTRDDCDGWVSGGPDVYSGWLPWKTLDLVEPSDDRGTKFRYAASRFFGGDRSARTPNSRGELIPASLNSVTPTSLGFGVPAGSPSNDVVAVIIATRGPLDTRNADADEYYYAGTSTDPDDNDVIAVITRQELMAAVEKRVANEVKACLEQHAVAPGNSDQTYPWPAPLANSIFKGTGQSLFGMIPATQPGGNPDVDLKQSIANLAAERNKLSTARANNDLATAQQALASISQLAASLRSQVNRLFIVAEAVYQNALAVQTAFGALANPPNSTTLGAARPVLAAFQSALADSGFDIFLAEVTDQNTDLIRRINEAEATPSYSSFNALQTQSNRFRREIYGYSSTPNVDIAHAIAEASRIATEARDLAAIAKNLPDYSAEPNITLADQAIRRARDLADANTVVYNTVLAIREFRQLARRLETLRAEYSASPNTEALNTLSLALNGASQRVATISIGSPTVLSAKAAASGALTATLPPVASTVVALTGTAITRLDVLADAIENNGDNVLLATLASDNAQLALAVSGSLGAAALKNTVDGVEYWATQTATYANDIARKARKRVNIPTDDDSRTSAYKRASQLLASLDGSTGSIAALNDYIQTPGDAALASKAQTAVNATQTALNNTLTSASTLETALESGAAQATTLTLWYGNACAFLQPPGSSPTWWEANDWVKTTFYQISERTRPASGRLTVNGAGNYRVVAIGAGRAVGTQDRLTAPATAASYLEGINADASRDGSAQNPTVSFSNEPVSAIFNDRLAH